MNQIQDNITSLFPQIDPSQIQPIRNLSASPRKFYRVTDRDQSWVVEYHPDGKDLQIARLQNVVRFYNQLGIRIPRLIFIKPEFQALVWEDVGDLSLLRKMRENGWTFEEFRELLFSKILPIQQKFWQHAIQPEFPFFSMAKYLFEWEFHVLMQQIAPIAIFDRNPLFLQEVLEEITLYIQQLLETRMVPVHRDFQSSNIFLKNGEICLLDFQDTHNGHPLYDLVSFIFDSYTAWKMEERKELLDECIDRFVHLIDPLRSSEQLRAEGYFLVFQRKLHDVGAFRFARKRTGKTEFESFIPSTLEMAGFAATWLNNRILKKLVDNMVEEMV